MTLEMKSWENFGLPLVRKGKWTKEEHEIFMLGLEKRPHIPWTEVAAMVQTRTPRQTRTHAQKYFQKLARRKRKQCNSQSVKNNELPTECESYDTPKRSNTKLMATIEPKGQKRKWCDHTAYLERELETIKPVPYSVNAPFVTIDHELARLLSDIF